MFLLDERAVNALILAFFNGGALAECNLVEKLPDFPQKNPLKHAANLATTATTVAPPLTQMKAAALVQTLLRPPLTHLRMMTEYNLKSEIMKSQ